MGDYAWIIVSVDEDNDNEFDIIGICRNKSNAVVKCINSIISEIDKDTDADYGDWIEDNDFPDDIESFSQYLIKIRSKLDRVTSRWKNSDDESEYSFEWGFDKTYYFLRKIIE